MNDEKSVPAAAYIAAALSGRDDKRDSAAETAISTAAIAFSQNQPTQLRRKD
jgi:hypothetical protein